MDIKDFLLARIAEDEEVARAVIPPGRAYTDGPLCWSAVSQAIGDATGYVVTYDIPGAAPRSHIARHDPARVLRECAAKRAILERLGPDENGNFPVRNLTIQLLMATVYSDHPDYQQEWAA